MSNLQVNLEIFEGPFELLLSLIKKNKINIYDIPISKLTEEYINSIKCFKNMDETSEFLFLATVLLQIKSKMLLPKQEDNKEEDPRKELVEKLIEYKKIKKISNLLEKRANTTSQAFFKEKDENLIKSLTNFTISIEDILGDINLNLLYNIFQDTMKRKEAKKDLIRSDFKSIKKPLYNIKNKILYINDLLKLKNIINVNLLFEESNCKEEVLVTFLAILQVVKQKDVFIKQKQPFSNIFLSKFRKSDAIS